MGRRSGLTKKQQNALATLVVWIIIIAIIIGVLVYIIQNFGIYLLILCFLIVGYFIFRIVRKYRKKHKLISEIGSILNNALEAMDNTARTYTNEEEANKELVSILKAQGHDATYQFRLSNGRYADAKIGDYLRRQISSYN